MSWNSIFHHLNKHRPKKKNCRIVKLKRKEMCAYGFGRPNAAITNFHLCFCFRMRTYISLLHSLFLFYFIFSLCHFHMHIVCASGVSCCSMSYIFHIVYVRRFNRTPLIKFAESLSIFCLYIFLLVMRESLIDQ